MIATLAAFVIGAVVSCFTCSTEKVKEVKIPYPVPCVTEMPAKPAFPMATVTDGDTVYVLAKKAAAEIELRKGYEAQLETTLEACKK